MKAVIGLIVLGIGLGIAIETFNYRNHQHRNAYALARMQFEIIGMTTEEAIAKIATLPPLKIQYWTELHLPWIVNGSAWGGFGGVLVGAVTGYVRRRKPGTAELLIDEPTSIDA